MFKRLLFTFLVSSLCMVSVAQTVQVVSTSPMAGESAVDQDSIEVVFNIPVKFNSMYPDSSGIELIILPEDSVSIFGGELKDNDTRLVIPIELADSTDFVAILARVEGANGEPLEAPYVFQFTTYQNPGPYTVKGQLHKNDEAQTKTILQEGFNGTIAILSYESLNLSLDFGDNEEDNGSEEESDEDEIIPVYASVVDPVTGEYTISGIRENIYYPFAINIFQEDMDDEGFFPEVYIYDLNGDYLADELDINTANFSEDTLTGIDLDLLRFDPFPFSEAINRAGTFVSGLDNNPTLVGGGTFYAYSNYQPEFTNEGISLKMKTGSVMQEDEPGPSFMMEPNGDNIIWQLFYYDSVKDSALVVYVSPFGPQIDEYVSEEDAEIPVDFSTINTFPETYIDSDSAMTIAEMEGGFDFRNPDSQPDFWEVELQALHEYWMYPPDATPTAPVFWKVKYQRGGFDFMEGEFNYDYLTIFIDVSDGTVLYKEGSTLTDGPPFNVIDSSPVEGATGVALSSDITFTFDAPILFGDEEEGNPGPDFDINVFPPDSIEIVSVELNDLKTELTISAVHTTDTDFTWIIGDAKSATGGKLAAPHVINYTTSATDGDHVVWGTVSEPEPVAKIAESSLNGTVVLLFTSNPFEQDPEDFSFDDDCCDNGDGNGGGDDDGGPDFALGGAGVVNPQNGDYVMEGIRDGEYFIFGINLFENSFREEPSELAIYDSDGDGIPDPITVSGGDLTNIDLEFIEFNPITARVALDIAKAAAEELSATYELIAIDTEYDHFDKYDYEDDHEDKPKLTFEPPFLPLPDGRSEQWNYTFFSASLQQVVIIPVGQFGILGKWELSQEEAEEGFEFPEDVSLNDLNILPETFVDSDSAANVANMNGGAAFLARDYPIDRIEVSIVGANAFFEAPEGVSEETNLWIVEYSIEYFNQQTQNHIYEDFAAYIDMSDGSFLDSEIFKPEPITALEGLDAALNYAKSMESTNELYAILGYSVLYSNPEFGDDQKLKQKMVDEESGINGEFFGFDYNFYSTTTEQSVSILVDGNEEPFVNDFPNNFLPDNTTFGDMVAINIELVIDSDSVMKIAETNGGEGFRNDPHPGFELVSLELDVILANLFWEYPDAVSSSTIAWAVNYRRHTVGIETDIASMEYARFVIDAETGTVISQDIVTSNEVQSELPEHIALKQNYPNPFNPSTNIPFELNKSTSVTLTIYNMLGQKVTTLANEVFPAGAHTLQWDASSMASGMYIYQLKAGDVVQTRKLMLIK